MKRKILAFGIIGALIATIAVAQVVPRRPIFGANTQVTNLTVDNELTVTGSCAGCGGDPAGTTGQVQVNNAGAFGAVSEGTSGQVLTSTGAGSAPTFQDASGGNLVLGGFAFDDGVTPANILPTGWTNSRGGAGQYTIQTTIDTTASPEFWVTLTAETGGTCGVIDGISESGGDHNFVIIMDDCAGGMPADAGVYFMTISGAAF